MCFSHRTINHSDNFIIHQDIKSLWSKFMKQIKNTKGIAGDMYNNECVFAGFEAVLILLRKY